MNAASSMWTMYRSLYVSFYSSKSNVFPPQCSSREVRPFFDPQVAMAGLHALRRFRLVVDTCFANSFFAERCGHFFLFQIVPMNPILFPQIWVPSGDPPSQVLVQVKCRGLYSPLRAVPICIALPILQRRGGSGVGLSQKASIRSGVRLFADCAMSYTIWIRQSLAILVSLLLSKV